MKKRILSIILVLAMFMSAFPLETLVAAQEAIMDAFSSKTEAVLEESITEEVHIIGEDESRRDETTKHYILSNGNRKAVKYAQPVHYKNNGKWVDIDNSLEFDETTNEYTNKANSFKVNFNKNSGSQKLFTIENNGYIMSWKYKSNSSKRSAVNGKPQAKETENLNGFDKYTQNVNSKIKYEGFEDKSTLEYVVTATGVKENIILQSADCRNEFTFEVKADGLTLTKNEDGSISVTSKETNEEVFYIPAPFMYDSNDEISYDVEYNITSKNKKYTLTLLADREWLNSADRAYPVTIDPVVETQQKKSTIASTFVSSKQPSTNFGNAGDSYVGVETANYGVCRSLFKITLPSLNKGDMVVGAYMGLYLHNNSFYTTSMPDKQINAHAITKSWNETSVTWNSNVTYDSIVLDYNYIKQSESNGALWLKQFDITRVVKSWYEGTSTNYGIMIKAAAETGDNADVAARSCFWTENQNGASDLYPYIAIEYRNNKGLEDYWSYTTAGAEDAGTAYVNDFTGNLVFANTIAGSSSELGALSIQLVYNGYAAGTKYVAAKGNNMTTTVGQGWSLNVLQTVRPSSVYGLSGTSASAYPYVYADSDGTEHYIYKDTSSGTTKYVDEDGLGLTLVLGTSSVNWKYRITDKADNKYYFNSVGNLYVIKDANGNEQLRATYDSTNKKIQTVKDAAGHLYTFTYNGDFITKITDPAMRETTLNYDSEEKIATITFHDGTYVQYEYDSDKCLSKAIASSGYTIEFSYTSGAKGKRVSSICEKAGTPEAPGTQAGQTVTFDRTQYNATVIRTAGLDGIHNTEDTNCGADDIITVLQFDNAGRTVSQQLRYGDGKEIGAGAYSYTSASDDTSTLGSKNKISSSASLGKNVVNLLTGGNGEDASLWEGSISATVTGTKTAVSTQYYMGKKALEVKNTALTDNGVNYFRQRLNNVKVSTKYTLSAYVKTVSLSDAEAVEVPGIHKGAYLQINACDSSGAELKTVYSEFLTEDTDTNINNGFRRLSTTIETPENTAQIRVYLCFRDMIGSAYFDCIQLEEGELASTYNMLENASFETASSGLPTKWTVKNITYSVSDGTITQGVNGRSKKEGASSMRILGSASTQKHAYQRVPVEANVNDTYIVSGWANAYAVSDALHSSYFDICPEVKYTKTDASGAKTTVYQKKPAAKFNPAITGWQYTATSFSLAYTGAESGCTYTPELVTVIVRYYNQANRGYFDHIMLCKEPAPTYTYDKEGNLVSVAANGEQSTNAVYDDNNDLVSYTDTVGNKTTMVYNDYHQLLRSKSPKGVYTANGYNDNGTFGASEKRNKETTSTSTVVVRTHQDYYADDADSAIKENAYVKSVYDEHGRAAATYTYDYATGAVTTVTDAKGTVTTNNYNSDFTKLNSVETGGSKVTYSYKEATNIISSILFGSATKNEQYGFEYDDFGRVTATKVGSTALSTNTYAARSGLLNLTTYGNGDTINYRYNLLGLVDQTVRTDGDNTRTFNWAYSSAGVLLNHTDSVNNRRFNYDYDSLGRLVRYEMRTQDNAKNIGFVEQGYDLRNNVNRLVFNIGDTTIKQIFSYSTYSKKDADGNAIANSSASYAKDNLPTLYQISGTRYATYNYDSINRLNKRTLSTNRPIYNNYVYWLSDRNATSTADTVDLYRTHQLLREIVDNTAYDYTYDVSGNITAISKAQRAEANTDAIGITNSAEYRSYAYDNLNQLIRENNATNNKTTAFSYDELGNITSKTEYAYTTGDLGTANKTVLYGYSNDGKQGWNNLLTSVDLDGDGVITANEQISYDEIGNPTSYLGNSLAWDGRQLTSYNGISYSYDADGIRASKTVGNTKTEYYYVGGMIRYQQTLNTETGEVTDGLFFYYDSYNHLTAIRHATSEFTNYYYVTTNMQGDVLGIYTSGGDLITAYDYDAWGNCTETHYITQYNIGTINPIRYRGYYYDIETGLYYVSSRYYDPEIGRWINTDALVDQSSVLGYNLFAYCRNNPVNMTDTTGNLPFFAITAAIGAVVGAVVGGVVAAKNGGNVWAGVGIGAAAGALIGTGAGMAAGAALAGSITATTGAVMAGGSTLVATVGTGGLGAGATYIANNLSQAANNLAPAAQTAASKMQEVATKGKAGEALSGLAKNTSHIPSLTGTASYRIPDGLDAGMRILSEVKNYSGTLSYTNQLKDFVMWSQANGYQMHLYTNATLTGPLQQVVDSGIIQLFPLG